jgi:manganese-dependent inorganic pyrophosphatase
MNKVIVIGHKNPDTDSVVSAEVLAKVMGDNTVSRIAGEANRETEFIFSFFKETLPENVSDEEIEKSNFFLVDHNEIMQSVVKKENITGVLDHHMLSGLKTDKPIFFRVEPVGSTSTLVYKMMKERGDIISEKDAGLLLAGVISDTLNLNSPTTTTEDIDSYYELSKVSKTDPNVLAEKMFEAKSDLSGKNIKDIVLGDLKEYEFGGKKIVISVAETTSLSYFEKNEKEIINALEEVKAEKKYDAFFFGAVDIIKKNTLFFPASLDESEVIKDVFQGEKKDSFFILKNISSRKLEIAPPLSDYYEKLI